uniref:Uncharacterized protein n=1 Tax=Oryzias melastigma TaxID=30732 RepID=A0A3B3BDK3_ORYME
ILTFITKFMFAKLFFTFFLKVACRTQLLIWNIFNPPWFCAVSQEIAEELLSDSSGEEVLTTRVVRRRIIIKGDHLPDIPPQTVTEEKYTDEHGNMVVKKVRFTIDMRMTPSLFPLMMTKMERRRGDPLLSADLPSAREDFEKVSGISLCWSTNRRLCCLNVIIRLS